MLDSTQSSSSLRFQQAMVDMVSRRSGSLARPRHASPQRSPPRSPTCRCRQSSSSPSCSTKRVRFDSPAPASALKSPRKPTFSRLGVMSLAVQGGVLFVLPVGGLGILGRGALGCPGPQGGVFHSFPLLSSFVINSGPPSELLPFFRQGFGSLCGGCRFTVQSSDRISVLGAWLLQPLVCNTEGHG